MLRSEESMQLKREPYFQHVSRTHMRLSELSVSKCHRWAGVCSLDRNILIVP